MAKNLKINIKNSQLAEALKINKQKKKPAETKEKVKETKAEEQVQAPIQEKSEVQSAQAAISHTSSSKSESLATKSSFAKEKEETKESLKAQNFPSEKKEDPVSHFAKEEKTLKTESSSGSTNSPPVKSFDKPYEKQTYQDSSGNSRSFDKPYQPRPQSDRPYQNRPASDRPYHARPQGDRPYSDRPYQPRSQSDRPYQPRPQGDRPPSDRPYQPRSQSDRPYQPRPQGDRPPSDRPYQPRQPYGQSQGGYNRDGNRDASSNFSRPSQPYSPRPPFGQRPFTPRPPRDGAGPIPAIPPKDLMNKTLDKDGVKQIHQPKKGFKTTVLDDDDFSKKSLPAHKDFRESALKKQKESGKSFDSRDRHGLRDSEGEEWRKRRVHKNKHTAQQEDVTIRPKNLSVRIPITVKDLAAAMKLKASQLISKLFMQGVIITLNDFLDDETVIQLLGHEFDCEITINTVEEDKIKITDKTIKEEIAETAPDLLQIRPPVVAFMGHVDHGKTSLIDAIRKSNRAAGEAGAITQHIGAFQCHTNVGTITILDTPGHEAFSEMRTRGADVTDIVVLVVAGDEGVKAQTLEALHQAEEAGVTVIVALNKCDKPNFNAENVYRQLADNNHLPEAWGGATITVNCSATTQQGVPELLEMLALQAEVLELKANPFARARGSVVESEMHKGLGAVATVLVQNGTLKLGDSLVVGEHFARIKTMHDEHGTQLSDAGPSCPVKITGLSGLPFAGSEFIVVKNEKEAKELSQKRTEGQRLVQMQSKKSSLENLLQKKAEGFEKKILPLILKADVQGSLEALKTSLLKIHSNKVELNFIHASVGEISESDIELAAASKAAIVGFHTEIESHAESMIKQNKVNVVTQDIIYHLVDEVKKLMLAQLDKIAEERDAGKAEVKAMFRSSHLGNIAGCMVIDGTIKRNQHIRVIRDDKLIWKGPIASLRKVKEDVREVSKGFECGILLQGFQDTTVGDILQAFDVIYLEQEL